MDYIMKLIRSYSSLLFQDYIYVKDKVFVNVFINPLMPGGNKKVSHTLFKYVWPFCYHQALKG